jgi:hypothetical protein
MMNKLFVVMYLMLFFPASAFAYIEPGTGMLMWQALIAVIGAVIVFVRHPLDAFRRFVSWIRRK